MRKYLTLAEVKEYLDAEANTRELGKFSSAAREHAGNFARLSAKETKKLIEELLNAKFSEEVAVKIADILPATPEEARAVLQKEVDVDENKVSTALEIVKKYIPKK
ncbi:MAG: RNA polymerase [Thermoplasmata archaeon]|nr:RNA polymerase [Thermoplasmata archaeon]